MQPTHLERSKNSVPSSTFTARKLVFNQMTYECHVAAHKVKHTEEEWLPNPMRVETH